MTTDAVMCLDCRCVYRQALTLLSVVQEGACPRCGYVGWTPAPPSAPVAGRGRNIDLAQALLARLCGEPEALPSVSQVG
jgi:hypothetical protein